MRGGSAVRRYVAGRIPGGCDRAGKGLLGARQAGRRVRRSGARRRQAQAQAGGGLECVRTESVIARHDADLGGGAAAPRVNSRTMRLFVSTVQTHVKGTGLTKQTKRGGVDGKCSRCIAAGGCGFRLVWWAHSVVYPATVVAVMQSVEHSSKLNAGDPRYKYYNRWP